MTISQLIRSAQGIFVDKCYDYSEQYIRLLPEKINIYCTICIYYLRIKEGKIDRILLYRYFSKPFDINISHLKQYLKKHSIVPPAHPRQEAMLYLQLNIIL